MTFTSFSIAGHSTWNFCPELDFMIDAGDGVASFLGVGKVAAIKTILLTHGHMDHVSGLANVIHLRTRPADAPPLHIYHADPCRRLELINEMAPGAQWHEIQPGERLFLGGGERTPFWAEAFHVDHGRAAIGYKIFQRRYRRNPAYGGLSTAEMQRLAQSGASDLTVYYDHHLLTYTGDTRPLPPELLGQPETLMHEATYPNEEMRTDKGHSTIQDALASATAIGAKLVVNHLSQRYREVNVHLPADVQAVRPEPAVSTVRIGG